eukprot:3624414-Alexandrium_andersonii.AAC.1
MSASLVGSEMCIRDRSSHAAVALPPRHYSCSAALWPILASVCCFARALGCLLYTSDAADDCSV